MEEIGVRLDDVTKSFGAVDVIRGVDMTICKGEFAVFVGPSGCGKSTLLRMIAGLEDTTSGKIRIGDEDVTHEDPAKRGVAMVFQSYALYPHLSVYENMAFSLRLARRPRAEIDKKVRQIEQRGPIGRTAWRHHFLPGEQDQDQQRGRTDVQPPGIGSNRRNTERRILP